MLVRRNQFVENTQIMEVKSIRPAPEDQNESQDFRTLFARNLNAVMDVDPTVPAFRGRAAWLAEKMGVSNSTAGLWLSGERMPDLARFADLIELLGCRAQDLLNAPDADAMIDENYDCVSIHDEYSLDARVMYTLPENLRAIGLPPGSMAMVMESDEVFPYLAASDMVHYDARHRTVRASGFYVLRINGRNLVRYLQVDVLGEEITLRRSKDKPQTDDKAFPRKAFSSEEVPGKIQILGECIGRTLMRR